MGPPWFAAFSLLPQACTRYCLHVGIPVIPTDTGRLEALGRFKGGDPTSEEMSSDGAYCVDGL